MHRSSQQGLYHGRVPRRPPTVFLHVGPPKTGTTYLQEVMWRNQARLVELGVTFPYRPIDHFHAAVELRGIEFGGYADPQTKGAWRRLARQALKVGTDKVVISHEVLAGATDQQIEAAVRSLDPAEVHVVYGARDLARQIPAVWQESLKNRRRRPYGRFVTSVLRSRSRTQSGAAFWRAQDAVAVLGRWARHLPLERIHVLTLPPRDAPIELLWHRYCAVLGIDPRGFDLHVTRTNTSLTQAEAEVLRRLNLVLPADLEWPEYERLVKSRFNRIADQRGRGDQILVPPRHRRRLTRHSQAIQGSLAEAGYDVVGDLSDLTPGQESFGPFRGGRQVHVADAAIELLAAALTQPAQLSRDRRLQARRWLSHLGRRGT